MLLGELLLNLLSLIVRHLALGVGAGVDVVQVGSIEFLLKVKKASRLGGELLELLMLRLLGQHLRPLHGELHARVSAQAGDLEVQRSVLLLENVTLGSDGE